MSDEYPDDFCEELQSPTAAAAAAAAAASAARPSPSSALRQSSSIRPAGAARQSSLSLSTLKANYSAPLSQKHAEMLSPASQLAPAFSQWSVAPAASATHTDSAATADRARIRELECKLEALEKEVAASRVKLRRAGRGGAADGAGAAGEMATAAPPPISSLSDSLGSNTAREIAYSSLQLGEQISGGGFCILYKARWSNMDVAVKRIFDPNLTEFLLQEFANETRMLSNLACPFIVQILAQVSSPPNLCIVTEFMPRGSLFHVLHQSSVEMTRQRKAGVSAQVATAIAFVHAAGVVHRDIKSLNVLAGEFLNVKLCDFGMARCLSQLQGRPADVAGTPAYMAVELFNGATASNASDMYAFGILLNEIWSQEVPFDGVSVHEIRRRVCAGERPRIAHTVPREVAQIIKECTAQLPAQRPSGFAKIIQTLSALQAAQPAS